VLMPDSAPRAVAGLVAALVLVSVSGRLAQGQDDSSELPEIVVTAERIERPSQRVPMSVTAVTSSDIEDAGMTDIGDVSQWVPDFTVVDWGSRRNTASAATPNSLKASTRSSSFRMV
jgi:iron complex outermembrane receptor protein